MVKLTCIEFCNSNLSIYIFDILHSSNPLPPLLKGGGEGGLGSSKNRVTRGGGVRNFLLERGDKPEKAGLM